MATESKIGLLLGLAIIFVIAFVINGLPRFGEVSDDEPSNDSLVEKPSTIADKERAHINTEIPTETTKREDKNNSKQDNNEESSTYTSLPPVQPIPPEPNEESLTPEVKTIAQKISELYYIVSEGDTLADIAKKFYGPIEGNKRANVYWIFLANRKLLASPHQIRVGQKLVIPRLSSSKPAEFDISSIFPDWMVEKVESIGRRQLPAETHEQKQIKEYVVREGDNLWSVAAAQLGDPTRYKEISRLNAGRLEDEDTLSIGMRLYLPAQ